MSTSPSPALAAPDPEGAALVQPRTLARSLGQLLSTQVLVAGSGFLALPILARNFGPEAYGRFSLFLTVFGVLSNLDFSRPLLVRERARKERASELAGLSGASALVLAPLALCAGGLLLGPLCALVLALCLLLHAAASPYYALLSADDRVGAAGAARNVAWSCAFLGVATLSFWTRTPHAWVWVFLGANLAVLLATARMTGGRLADLADLRPSLGLWAPWRRPAADLLGYSAASAVIVSSDRVLLERSAGDATFGQYAGPLDVAVKLNVLSTALSNVLYPALARSIQSDGLAAAEARFVRLTSWIVVGYFLLVATLLRFHEAVLDLLLGDQFGEAGRLFPFMLFGVFVNLFGFLLTVWRRARGEFAELRRIYNLSAFAMLLVGPWAIPMYGPAGALATWLIGRTSDLQLLFGELRRVPRSVLGRGSVLLLFGFFATLLALAWAVR